VRARDHRTREALALRNVELILLGGITGMLLSRLLFPVVFERGGSFVFLAPAVLLVGVVLIARLSWRVRP
jgi:hypothetical protein